MKSPTIQKRSDHCQLQLEKKGNKKAFHSKANHPLSQMNKFKQVLGRGQGRLSRDTPEEVPMWVRGGGHMGQP